MAVLEATDELRDELRDVIKFYEIFLNYILLMIHFRLPSILE